jgi:hypothetical protein
MYEGIYVKYPIKKVYQKARKTIDIGTRSFLSSVATVMLRKAAENHARSFMCGD